MRDLLEIQVEGPDRFCPTCGRALVRVGDDGVMDIADKTHVEVEQHGDETPLLFAATCLPCEWEQHCPCWRHRVRRLLRKAGWL